MKNRHIAFGIVGLLIGFVLGFFISETSRDPIGGAPQQVLAQGQEQLPEGHPPIDVKLRIQEMEQHANENPDHVEAKIQLANLFYDIQRFQEAIPWYEKALQQQAGNINVSNDLATCYFVTGNRAKAFVVLQQSLEIEIDHPVTLQNLGWFHFQDSNFPEAIQNWELLIQVHPEFQNIEEVKEQLENAKAHQRGEHS